MKSFSLFAAVLALGLTLGAQDADAAKRLGGGKNTGMQRESVSAPSHNNAAAPMAAKPNAAAATPQTPPKRSWMGPLAGLAAGLGLAALASHFGFGEELANMMMIGLLVLAVLAVVGFIMRKKAQAAAPSPLQYAGLGGAQGAQPAPQYDYLAPAGGSAAAQAANQGHIPADFDVAGFERNAKVNFIRLQAANDAGNLDDIREFTTPEMFAEIKMDLAERGQATQETDVLSLDASVLNVAEEAGRYIVSVRFNGMIAENKGAPEAVDEVWHLVKSINGQGGWVVAGIQQNQ